MDLSWLGGVAGGLLGLGGSALGAGAAGDAAQAQIDAANQNRDFDQRNLNQGMARYLAATMGPQRAEQYLRGTLGTQQFDALFNNPEAAAQATARNKEMQEIQATLAKYGRGPQTTTRVTNDGLNQQQVTNPGGYDTKRAQADGVDLRALQARQRELKSLIETGDAATSGTDKLDLGAFRSLGPGTLDQYKALGDTAEQQGRDNLAQYGVDSDRLMQQSRGIEGMARRFGQGERDRINRETGETLSSLQRGTEAKLMARGLGASTILSQQRGGNARQVEQTRQNALGALGDRQIGLQTQLAGNTLGLGQQRFDGRMGLTMGNQDRVMGMRRGEVDFQNSIYGGSIMNPWLSRNTQQYFSGASPSAAQGATWGASLSGLGGNFLGASLESLNAPKKKKNQTSPYEDD